MSGNWSSKSPASRRQHAVFYKALSRFGLPVAYFMLFFVVIWYVFSPQAAHYSRAYLKRRFPRSGFFEGRLHRFRLFHAFGKILVDRAWTGITGRFRNTTGEADVEQLRALAAEGRGVILLSAHAGCWQLGLAALDFFQERVVHVVMHKNAEDNDKHFFEHGKKKAPFSIIDPTDGLGGSLAMAQALQRGEMVAMLGDRFFTTARHTLWTPFMGEEAELPILPYMLAAATGAPILVCFALRSGAGEARWRAAGCIRVPPGKATPEFCLPYASRYARMLEELVEEHPYQFFNFHDLWERHADYKK